MAKFKKSLSDIKHQLLRPALTSHYYCEFPLPGTGDIRSWIGDGMLMNDGLSANPLPSELISINCAEASLPGASLLTHELNDDFSGVTERHAYRRSYDDRADFTFYVDRDYKILLLFNQWINYIAGEGTSADRAGRGGSPLDDSAAGLTENTNSSFRAKFPEDYVTQKLCIYKFERDQDGLHTGELKLDLNATSHIKYNFINAYPISINSIPVSYESSQLLKVTVSFSYSRYYITNVNTDGALPG